MFNIVFGNLTKPDGSACIEHYNTIVQAAVYGPIEVPSNKINYEKAYVEVIYKPKISIPTTSPAFEVVREIEFTLKTIFQDVIIANSHPRTMISIVAQEIYNAGSLISALVNAINCALLDAGLPLKTPVAAMTILRLKNTDPVDMEGGESCQQLDNIKSEYPELLIHPNCDEELNNYSSKFQLVFDNQNNITTINTSGNFDFDTLKRVTELGRHESGRMMDMYRQRIKERFEV